MVHNVSLHVLDCGNFTVEVETPPFSLGQGEDKDILLTVTAPILEEDQEYATGSIIIQAEADNEIVSNAADLDIVFSEPGFTTLALVTATAIGALVAFFRRRNRNR